MQHKQVRCSTGWKSSGTGVRECLHVAAASQSIRVAIMNHFGKFMLLLVLAFVAIQYVAISTFLTNPLSLLYSVVVVPTRQAVNCSPETLSYTSSAPAFSPPTNDSNVRTHILILATTRCGSSFIGQLLNQHPEVFYLFEPLFHVHSMLRPHLEQSRDLDWRKTLMGAARDLLRSLYHCHLSSLENYIQPYPTNHSTDHLFRRGASQSLCSPPVCKVPQGPHEQSLVLNDERECKKRCGPLSMPLASDACRAKRHTAIKTVRIPQISDLRTLIEDPTLNLKVIQLVRDPRGILASRIEAFRDSYRMWRLWRATGRRPANLDLGQIRTLCEDVLKSVSIGLARPDWLKGRYMLLRYEDMARFPLKKTKELYRFLGLDLDQSVKDWINNNTHDSSGVSSRRKFTTIRDSAANAENWKTKLSFDMVVYIQSACKPLLQRLGYKAVFHSRELKNFSHSLVEDRMFLPFF
ncbi:carbohydrate sulfotransferase 1-like [Solea senegalensis]|uniref:Sulfotransferase n=2 Tax=Solea senegalensis TaxID=28829 RepID=A0AAV6SYB4_SOLSE|nr:carbohydrate sulfotransferase 1-like [Solea senegalensis]